MSVERKAVWIEVKYDDGLIERAVDDNAAQIWKAINSAFVMQHIHGFVYKGPKLNVVQEATSVR